MLPMRSAAAAPCSLAALLLRRLSSHSSSSAYSVSRRASSALSSQPSASHLATSPPCPLSSSRRTRGFAAWASAPGPAESPATKALEAKVPSFATRPRGFSLPLLSFCCKFQRFCCFLADQGAAGGRRGQGRRQLRGRPPRLHRCGFQGIRGKICSK
ncbi:hypothetical protein PVAP13_4KG220600 [Panicum virgatum]|uniref:Uncharacterized protein n=1 Tax=Panicum virgatum TaxID=38727 RepID=A0A8T0TP89_PANVG|nr:hypothetical protein PVAP13_4KG220600 [Panicum virgatum]